MRIKACARLIERQRLESEAQLRKASEEEELAKIKKEKREKEAQERKAGLKALLNAKMRDSLSARVGTAIEHCILEE
ncbi:hypothetical protein HBI52_191050 [Parastagonospora nodorum]|nr:hypothetical protein HBI52_191050 [Parastagonospora nodorum]